MPALSVIDFDIFTLEAYNYVLTYSSENTHRQSCVVSGLMSKVKVTLIFVTKNM
jgi:hypothetical protein